MCEVKRPMGEEEFNELLTGALAHPFPMFMISRLAMALMHVVKETGAEGAEALRAYCRARQDRE